MLLESSRIRNHQPLASVRHRQLADTQHNTTVMTVMWNVAGNTAHSPLGRQDEAVQDHTQVNPEAAAPTTPAHPDSRQLGVQSRRGSIADFCHELTSMLLAGLHREKQL